MPHKFLDKMNSPADLRALTPTEAEVLSYEIRELLVGTTLAQGGHLASNLGAVELTLAIHSVFDSPRDRIIFDVGHQSYVHKLITGRRDRFPSLRTQGGLSGFTSRRESEHDPFGAGHASTSLSAAIGFATADLIRGEARHTVAVVGDGAYTGGMIHEALNNLTPDLPLVVILNENGMSISTNRGAFADYLSGVRASREYRSIKRGAKRVLGGVPAIGAGLIRAVRTVKRGLVTALHKSNYFEDLGLYYIGTVDGHDLASLERALSLARDAQRCTVVHVRTRKGRGYPPAEASPDAYHSVSPHPVRDGFTRCAARAITSLAERDGEVVAVTAAMGIGTGLSELERAYPERCFDVGIAEAHAVTFAAGLSASGMKPYVAIYSTFLTRACDSILHDASLQRLPVRFLIDRAGLSLGDGVTHHGIFDVSLLSGLGVTVISPISYSSLTSAILDTLYAERPIAIRYPNAEESPLLLSRLHRLRNTRCGILADFDPACPTERLFITYSHLYERVFEARDALACDGASVGVIVLELLTDIFGVADELLPVISESRTTVFAEEGIRSGGVAERLLTALVERGLDTRRTCYRIAAIDDPYITPDVGEDIYDLHGLSKEKLIEKMTKI